MGDIYKAAAGVRLWLGDEADDRGMLLRHLRTDRLLEEG